MATESKRFGSVASMTERYSFGHKVVSVALSVVLLGFGWPTSSLAKANDADAVESDVSAQVVAQDDASQVSDIASDAAGGETATAATDASEQDDSSGSAATEADIALELNNAFIEYEGGQPLSAPATRVTVPANKDFEFSVAAIAGYVLDNVSLTVSGAKTTLTADSDDVYTVPASSVKAGATITLNTSVDKTSAGNAGSSAAVDITESDGDLAGGSSVSSAAQSAANSQSAISVASAISNALNGSITGNDALEVGKFAVYAAEGFSDTAYWTTSDNSIATVEQNGVVTAVAAGTVTITAEAGDETASKTITVTKASSARGYKATITPTIENAEVAYYAWHDTSDTSSISFGKATGTVTINDYTTWYEPGYVVFFVKPNSNHIVTGLGASGNGDIYAVDATDWGNINGYPNIAQVMAAAKAAGYVAAFGWSRSAGQSLTADFTINAKSPDMTVAAVSDRTTGVQAGDELTFTVTITPKTTGSGKDSVAGVHVNSADVNGTEVTVEGITGNTDGTFTGTVHYTATEADVARGSVVLTVEATSTYEGAYTITSGDIASSATVTKEATATCEIAPSSQVKYTFVSGTSGKSLPGAINAYLPSDSSSYNAGKTAKAKNPTATVYEDSKNDGYWTFTGWDKDSVKVGRKGEPVTFTGTWTFTQYSKYTVKYVDEDGNELSYVDEDGNEHSGSDTFSGVKVDDKVKVSDIEKPSITGYSYSKSNPTKDLKIDEDDSKNVITLTYKKKTGKAGYYLVLDNASWEAPSDTTKDSAKPKWYYNYGLAKGDKFTVTDSEPSADNHVFIGWMDKERGSQAAAIHQAGSKVTYCYDDDQTYTLDALWASLSATGEDVTYDGTSHTVTVDVSINEGTGLDPKYAEQAKELIKTGDVEYSTDGGDTWSKDKPSFKNAGTYTVQVRQAVTVGDKTTPLTAEATVKIAQKEYWVETDTASKVYDGEELVGTAEVKGLVDGESAFAIATTIGPDVIAETKNAVTGEIVWAEGADSANYKRGEDKLGTLEITKRNVVLKSADLNKPYDGTALTNGETALAEESGWVEGEGASYKFTGSQTSVGNSGNEFSYTLNDNTKAKNYNIAKSEGTLKVTDRSDDEKYKINVEGCSTTVTYDGQKHEASGITSASSTYTNDKNAKFTITADTTNPESTDVVSQDNKVSNVKVTDASGNDVTAQFKINVIDGKLTINKRTLTFASAGGTKVYDGTPLIRNRQSDVTIGGDGFVAGEGATFDITGTQTNVGDSDNTFTYAFKDGTLAGNYSVTSSTYGKLIVTADENEVVVTIKGNSQTLTYDGAGHTVQGYSVQIEGGKGNFTADDIALNEGVDLSVFGTDVAVNSEGSVVAYTKAINASDFKSTNGNFANVKFVVDPAASNVSLTINKRDVALTSEGGEWPYDGKPHSKPEVTSSDDLFASQVSDLKATGSVTNVSDGEVPNRITYTSGESFKETNFNITKSEGKLKVVSKPINPDVSSSMTITAPTDVVYNGNVQKQEPIVKDGETTLTKGVDYELSYSDDVINAGTVDVTVTGKGNYTGEAETSYQITARPVVLTSGTQAFTYDGKAHTLSAVSGGEQDDIHGTGFVTGEVTDITATGSVTNVSEGEVVNAITYTTTDKFIASNYSVTKNEGKLWIVAKSDEVTVTITENSDSYVYDGTEKSVSGYKISNVSDSLYSSSSVVFAGVASHLKASGTAEGFYQMELVPGDFSNIDKNFGNVRFVIVDGGLTINKQTIDPGTDPSNPDPAYKGVQIGTLDDVVYSGQSQQQKPTVSDKEGNALVEGRDYQVTFSEDTTNAGTVTVTVSGIGNYSGSVKRTYQITPRELAVTTPGNTKVYDGAPLIADGTWSGCVTGFVEGESAAFRTTGTITNVGSEDNTYVIDWKAEGNTAKSDNYKIVSETLGKLVVTKQSIDPGPDPENPDPAYNGISIDSPSDVTYDAKEHKWVPVVTDAKGNKLAEGTDYEVSYSTDDFTNVRTITVTIKGKGDYSGTATRTYTINKRAVALTSESHTFTYNGQAQSWNKFAYSDELFASQVEGLGCYATVTKVGETAENVVKYNFKKGFSADNYDISTEFGTLSVKNYENEIVVTTKGGTSTYDGTSHGATVTVSELPAGYSLVEAESSASATDVTPADGVPATADKLKIVNASGDDVTSELNITKVDGTIVVNPATLTVVTPSKSKVYDGSALTAEGSISGLVNNETVDFKTTGSQTAKGDSVNTYDLAWTGTAKQGNYKVSEDLGTLVVTEQSIDPGTDPVKPDPSYDGVEVGTLSDVVYNGKSQQLKPSVTGKNGSALVEDRDYTVSFSADTTNVGTVTVTITGKGNYTGTVKRTYAITKRPVTIESGNATKIYDGSPLTSPDAIVTSYYGFVYGEVTDIKAIGSITDFGSDKNDISYIVHEDAGFRASNYDITLKPGTLTVTKASAKSGIELAAQGASKMYDGTPLALPAAAASAKVKGNAVTIEYSVDGTSWTTDASSITVTNVSDSKKIQVRASSSKNYDGYVYDEATLTISVRNVTLSSETKSKTYDGTALTAPDVTVSGDGFVEGEVSDVRATGTITNVGSESNTIVYTKADSFIAGNYSITTEPGTLTVDEKSLDDKTITVSNAESVTYDGQTHKFVPVVTDGTKTLVEGVDYAVSYSTDDFTNVTGTITVTITGKGNYSGTAVRSYSINPKSIKVSSASDEWVYDGTEHSNSSATIDGLVNNADAAAEGTGKITNVGNKENTIKVTYASDQMAKNYSIVENKPGTLSVKDSTDQIVVKVTGGTFVYTGVAWGASVEVTGIPDGYKLGSAICTAKLKDVGSVEAKCEKLVILNADGKDVTKELNIKYVDGTIKVTPATLTVVTEDAEKVYDGEALSAGGSITGFKNGETATLKTTGSQTYVGESDNTYSIVWGTADSKNYTVAATLGKLEVKEPADSKVITKTHKDGTYGLGDTVSFTVTATNVYSEAKTMTIKEQDGVKLDQSVFEKVQSGDSVTATATYTITEADILAGSFKNTATVSFSDTKKTYSAEDTVTVDDANPSLVVSKSTTSKPANGSTYELGETIAYDVTVTNNGNLTATDVVVSDELNGATLVEGQSAQVSSLAPGASATVKYVYTVTESDILAGKVVNNATASGKTAGNDPTVTPGSTEDKTDPKNGLITVTKVTTSKPENGKSYTLGETISYQITVTNDGNLTVTGIEVSDPNADNFGTRIVESLAPGDSVDFTATHVVTESDIRAGKVVNVATAEGTSPDPDKPNVPGVPGTDEEPTDTANAALTVVKTAEQNGSAEGGAFKLGETINYTITVTNTGNQTASNVKVTDPNADGFGEKTISSLAPGKSQTYAASHKVTQSDILAGSVVNTATAKGTDPSGNDVDGNGSDTKTIDPVNTTLNVEKTASAPADGESYKLGEEVEYTITVTNNGNVDYSNVKVVDAQTGLNENISTLAVGESKPFTVKHVITEADIVAGTYVNTATAQGDSVTDGKGNAHEVKGEDTETIGGDSSDKKIDEGNADLAVSKTVTNKGTGENGAFKLGDTIEYAITVTNNGNLTVNNFQVVDNNADGFEPVTITSLAPGATTQVVTAKHVVTSDDIQAGGFKNVATTSGGTTDDKKVTPNPTPGQTDTEVDGIDATLEVAKVAGAPADGAYKLGETVTYTVTVTNKGNVLYANVKVADEQTGLDETIATLAVGESKEFTTTHVIDEADIVAGTYKNVATANADSIKDPKTGEDITPSGEGTETIGGDSTDKPIDGANPQLVVTKTSDVATDHLLKEGESVNYTVTVANTGNLTLTNIAVDDQLEGATLAEGESATIESLAPGASATLHYSYTVKQSDVVNGFVANHATATADNPSDKGTDVTPGDKTDPTEKAAPSLFISKTADKTANVTAGDVITYTITAVNNGNVDLTGVVVTDELVGFESDSFDLARNASKTFTQTYTVTEADMVAGSVKNVASATAKDPSGNVVPGSGETTTETEAIAGALSVVKTAAAGSYAAGDTVEYTIVVTNVGNVTVSDIKVADAKTGLNETVTLAKGESATFTTGYVVTAEDIAAGTLENVATAKGTDPAGKDVEGSGSETIGNKPQPDPSNPDEPTLKRQFTASNPSNVVYNGAEQLQKPVVTDGSKVLVEGVDYELSYSDATNVGTVTVTVTGKGNYTGSVEVAYQITKRPVTLTSESKTWVYDGSAHTVADVVCSDNVFASQVEGLKATGSVTNVGDSATNAIVYSYMRGFSEDNFAVTKVEGTLGITAQSIDPGTDPDKPKPGYLGVEVGQLEDVVYNGQPQQQKPSVVGSDGKALVEGTDYLISFSADTTNVGTVTATVTGIGNFTGKVERTYRITPAPLAVTTASDSKVFDGTALTKTDEWTLEGLVAGETATVKATGAQTAAGSSDNTYELVWGTAVASNYQIVSEKLGVLTVKAQSITPGTDPDRPDPSYTGATVSEAADLVYDGAEHKWAPVVTDAEGNVLVEGRDYTVEYATDDFVNVGSIAVTITGTGNYSGSVMKLYRITPATLQVTTPSADKVYDGEALTAAGTISGFVAGETADFRTTGTQTVVGNSANSYEIAWTGTAKQSNYVISESIGMLTVKESADEIVITVTGGVYTYDGKAHAATVSVGTVPTGYKVETAETAASATDVTTEPVKTSLDKLVIRNASGEDVTSKLNVRVNEGSITVNPAELVVATPDANKVYDGEALTAEGSISGFVAGETADFRTTGTQTAVGSSANSYEIAWTGTAKQSNYVVSETIGTLTVKEYAGSIVATTTGGTYGYDGAAHGAIVRVSGVPAGYTVESAASSATATNVAEGVVPATADQLVIRNAAGEDVTSKLDIVYVDGSITILPATLYVTTGSASKVYDGQALTSATLEIVGLVNGDRVRAAATGAQTEVGSSANTYRITWGDVDSRNYSIVENLGTLTVSAAPVVPVTPGNTVTPTTPGTTPGSTASSTANTPVPTVEQNGETSQASPNDVNEELIYDSETPLGSSEGEAHCWAHYLMFLGAILTMLYGALVAMRRSNYTRDLKKNRHDILGGGGDDDKDPEGASAVPAPATMGA